MPDGDVRAGSLGAFLRDRRERLDPVALGFSRGRRRTSGLRREEVAARAGISATWVTWLEQGRGGAPSAEALEGLSGALCLAPAEREHLFLLALGRPPEVRWRPPEGVTPQLQRVLDALEAPATVRTVAWDVVAWNRAATRLFHDYGSVPPERRNVLRMMFLDAPTRARQADWTEVAAGLVAVFRAEVARTGAQEAVRPLVEGLCRESAEFAALWRGHDVQGAGEGVKRILHPVAGALALEMSAFAVDGRPDLVMTVYTPATPEDAARMRSVLEG